MYTCLVCPQCLGQWYFMDWHWDLLQGKAMSTNAVKRKLILPWYSAKSSLSTGLRTPSWTSKSKLNATQNLVRVVSEIICVTQKKICSWRAIDIHHPPFMRRTLGNIYEDTPCLKYLKPSRPPSSTFLFDGIFVASPIKKSSTSLQTFSFHINQNIH